MKPAVLLCLAFVVAVLNIHCGNTGADFNRSKLAKLSLLVDGGFEQGRGWSRSAPPGYSQYASIEISKRIRRSGRKSDHVAVFRHPSPDGKILHGLVQRIDKRIAGRRVVFGGWVRTRGRPEVRFGLDYEVATPKDGRTFFSSELPQPPDDGEFHLLFRDIILPEDAGKVVFFAGISSIGEAWFDDVFLIVKE